MWESNVGIRWFINRKVLKTSLAIIVGEQSSQTICKYELLNFSGQTDVNKVHNNFPGEPLFFFVSQNKKTLFFSKKTKYIFNQEVYPKKAVK